jgi:hypothetical protein
MEKYIDGNEIIRAGPQRLKKIQAVVGSGDIPMIKCMISEAPDIFEILLEYCNKSRIIAKVYDFKEVEVPTQSLPSNNDFNVVGYDHRHTFTQCHPINDLDPHVKYNLNFTTQKSHLGRRIMELFLSNPV